MRVRVFRAFRVDAPLGLHTVSITNVTRMRSIALFTGTRVVFFVFLFSSLLLKYACMLPIPIEIFIFVSVLVSSALVKSHVFRILFRPVWCTSCVFCPTFPFSAPGHARLLVQQDPDEADQTAGDVAAIRQHQFADAGQSAGENEARQLHQHQCKWGALRVRVLD